MASIWSNMIPSLHFQALAMPQEAIMCYQRALQVRPDYAMAFGESCLILHILYPVSCVPACKYVIGCNSESFMYLFVFIYFS